MSDGQQGARNGPIEPAGDGAPRGKADHLRAHRFEPGKSGNPRGRPKGTGVTAALREIAESEHHGKRVAVLLAEQIVKHALSGKFQFCKEVVERLEGKVPDKVVGSHEQRLYVCPPPRVIGEGDSPPPRLADDAPEEGGGD